MLLIEVVVHNAAKWASMALYSYSAMDAHCHW